MRIAYQTNNPFQTKKIGEALAKKILGENLKEAAQTIGLEGELGGGKTTFLQGFARGLGIKEKILSPTFVILKKFKIPKTKQSPKQFQYFYHVDCYRLEKIQDLLVLGFREILTHPQNIIAIEWPNIIKENLPKHTIFISFYFCNHNKRKIIIKWPKRKKD